MLGTPIHIWVIFGVAVAAALAIDLGIFHRKGRKIKFQEAVVESAAWVGLALVFNLWVYISRGPQAGIEFLTGYLVEKSLSVDNLFVFVLVFQTFRVPAQWQHKVLYYGVVGALVMRAVFVVAGVELLRDIHEVLYIFGALLLFTGIRMLLSGKRLIRPERNWLVRLAKRIVPVSATDEGEHFFVKKETRWYATPLFLALISVEAMDIVFAIDSVPAVLAITRNTFIVYSSNVFAILGLRAMYFAIADILPRFPFFHQGIAAILACVGMKMLLSERVPISAAISLGIIAGILALTVLASLFYPPGKREKTGTRRA
jgi:tellurite resistance protein TerC